MNTIVWVMKASTVTTFIIIILLIVFETIKQNIDFFKKGRERGKTK